MKDLKVNKLFNRTGSKLFNIARVDYSQYQNKLLDLNAQLRLNNLLTFKSFIGEDINSSFLILLVHPELQKKLSIFIDQLH